MMIVDFVANSIIFFSQIVNRPSKCIELPVLPIIGIGLLKYSWNLVVTLDFIPGSLGPLERARLF